MIVKVFPPFLYVSNTLGLIVIRKLVFVVIDFVLFSSRSFKIHFLVKVRS